MQNTLLPIISLLMSGIYFLIGIIIHIGLAKRYKRTIRMPMVSVLIPARNEEDTIAACLNSIKKQDYPSQRLQIIILNDRSSDETRNIVLDHLANLPDAKLIDISDDLQGLKGKMNVLAQGMIHAQGEIILITDADCQVPVSWVSQMVSYFDENVGMVGGLTAIQDIENTSKLFNRIQTLDWFFLQAIAAGTAGAGLPVSVLGNNFGFRKSVYDEIGGFSSIGFSLTEDMALLNTIKRKTNYKIAYPLHHKSMIESIPLSNFHEFIQQRKRWLSGGLDAPFWGWILMLTSFLAHLLILINLITLNFSIFILNSFIILTIVDISLIWKVSKLSKSRKLIRYFIPFEIFYYIYSIILAVVLFLPGKIYWKERSFSKTGIKKPR
jgi:cellulose synthase/poly-beta-1,6-N-acetylglucosamine synthase-like glycosyltransferase